MASTIASTASWSAWLAWATSSAAGGLGALDRQRRPLDRGCLGASPPYLSAINYSVEAAARASPFLTVLVVAMFVGLVLIIAAVTMRSGSRKARILTTVVGAVSFLFVWTIPLGVVALVMQFSTASGQWVRAQPAWRGS